MRARALLSCLLVAIAALVWLGLGSAWRSPTPPSPPMRHAGTAHDSAAGATRTTRAADSARTAVDLDQLGAVAPTRTVRIEAVFADDGRPAAGAEVRYWPPRSDAVRARDLELWRNLDDLEAALRQTGRLALADLRGLATLDAEDGSEVAVRCAEYYAVLDLAFDPAPQALPLRVLLHRDVTLRVLVTDPQDKPLPGVALTGHLQIASRQFGTDNEHESELGCTDAQGLLTKPHLPLPGADVVDWSMQLGCDATHLQDTRRPVSLAELRSGAPIRFVLPAGGTIELTVVDQDGRPVPTTPQLRDAHGGVTCTPTSRQWDPCVVFAQVPLGRTFTAVARGSYSLSIQGPRQNGEVVRTSATLQRRTFWLRGRLCRADGLGLDGVRFELTLHAAGAAPASISTAAGDDGRFDCTLQLDGADLTTARASLQARNSAPLAIDRNLAPGTTELGDIAVPAPPGEVLLASVRVHCEGRSIAASAVLDLRGGDGRRRNSVRHRDGDRLLVRGVAEPTPMSLVCSHRDCAPVTVQFTPGAELDLDLQRATRLWLSLEPPPLPTWLLCADLYRLDAAEDHATGGADAGFGRYRFDRLVPGRYHLRITAGSRLLYEATDLELAAGDNFLPPDRGRLELRRSARAIHISARGSDGRLLQDAGFLAVPTGAQVLPTDWEAGGDWLLLPDQPIDVLVWAPGHVPARIVQPLNDARIALPRNVTVRLLPPDGDPVEVQVRVARDGVGDAALRRFDEANQHELMNYTTGTEPQELPFAPGTEIEVRTIRGELTAPWQRVAVGDQGPKDVLLR